MKFLGTLLLVALAALAQAEPIYTPSGTLIKPEVVLTDGSKPCDKDDYPDTPARAYRTTGGVALIAGSKTNHRWLGEDLTHLKRQCKTIFQGKKNPDPTHHNYYGWLHSIYATSNKNVYALVHNEFHGHRVFPECKSNYIRCWWNDVDWAQSTDGGKTFTSPPANKRLVIGLAATYRPNIGKPVGFMNPSGIVSHQGYLYAIVHGMAFNNQPDGNYLIRKAEDGPWNNWQVWSPGGFSSISERLDAGGPVGLPLDLGNAKQGFTDPTPMKVQALVQHTPSGQYVALMSSKQPEAEHPERDGFYIATSADLLTWSSPTQILQANLRPTVDCKTNPTQPIEYYRYANLIDPKSKDRNFATIGNNPYLYTTRISGKSCTDKNKTLTLIRLPVTISATAP